MTRRMGRRSLGPFLKFDPLRQINHIERCALVSTFDPPQQEGSSNKPLPWLRPGAGGGRPRGCMSLQPKREPESEGERRSLAQLIQIAVG